MYETPKFEVIAPATDVIQANIHGNADGVPNFPGQSAMMSNLEEE